MTWRPVTALVLVGGLLAWIVYDLFAYAIAGNDATISRLLLDTATWQPGVALSLVFAMGVLIGHLFVPQHVYLPAPAAPVPLFAKALPMSAPAMLSFVDVPGIVAHVLNLLQTQGSTAISAVNNGMKIIKAATGRDMLGVFEAINAEVTDVNTIITAIKVEFGV